MLPIIHFRILSVVRYILIEEMSKYEKRIKEICYHAIMNLPEILTYLEVKISGL